MTEKRFTVHRTIGMLSAFYVNDNLSDKVVIDQIIHKYEADRLCKKLNELSDENEQLKQYKQAVSDVLLSYSQKNLSAKQLGLLTAIMHELGVLE